MYRVRDPDSRTVRRLKLLASVVRVLSQLFLQPLAILNLLLSPFHVPLLLSFEGLRGWVHRDSSGGGVGEGTCVAVGTGSGGADVAAESHLAAVIGKSSGGTNLRTIVDIATELVDAKFFIPG